MIHQTPSAAVLPIAASPARDGEPFVAAASPSKTLTTRPAPASGRRGLHALFAPKSIAVVGASERPGSLGRALIRNLVDGGFAGPVWPVNIKGASVFGCETAVSVCDLPGVPDLVVVTTPAQTVEQVLADCARVGVPAAIVLSSETCTTSAGPMRSITSGRTREPTPS